MKATLNFEDGKKVELSEETTNRLRKELVKDDGQLVVDRFRAVKAGIFVRIAIVPGGFCFNWDGSEAESDDFTTHLLYKDEVRHIIVGLEKMIS